MQLDWQTVLVMGAALLIVRVLAELESRGWIRIERKAPPF